MIMSDLVLIVLYVSVFAIGYMLGVFWRKYID